MNEAGYQDYILAIVYYSLHDGKKSRKQVIADIKWHWKSGKKMVAKEKKETK